MLKQTHTLSRRKFLKGAAYASALSAGSFSGLAAASSPIQHGVINGTNATVDGGLLAVTLSNQSDQAVALDALNPVSLDKVNGWIVVKINKARPDTAIAAGQQISLAAGQSASFTVDAEVAPTLPATSTYIVITNEYSYLDNMVPVTQYDTMVA